MLGGYVPAEWFNRYHDKLLMCRNPDCKSRPQKPFFFYCSSDCKIKFEQWFEKYIMWSTARWDILVRDNFTCQKCNTCHRNDYEYKLDVDHIKPRAIIYDECILEFRKLPPKEQRKTIPRRKFYIDFLKKCNDPKNLRTLCKSCHKKVSIAFNREYQTGKRKRDRDDVVPLPKPMVSRWARYGYLNTLINEKYPYTGLYYFDEDSKRRELQKLTPLQLYNNEMNHLFDMNPEYFAFNLFQEHIVEGNIEVPDLHFKKHQRKILEYIPGKLIKFEPLPPKEKTNKL